MHLPKRVFYICFIASMLVSCNSTKVTKPVGSQMVNPKLVKYEKVEKLLNRMTLEEKIGQMNQYNGFWDLTGPAPAEGDASLKYDNLKKGLVGSMLNIKGVKDVRKIQKIAVEETRLGIPLLFGFDVIHGFKVQSPIPLAEAASWDLEAIEASARLAATEASAAGINWTFAPMVDISRDARWGRVMEGAGEDPFLGSKIAEARVKGFQGDDLSKSNTVAACVKHFAAYGFAEAGRDYNTADLGTSTLYNVVFPPFRAAASAGAVTFMNSFNELNGVPATTDKWLQRDILKGEWGFEGFMVSDWGSMRETIAHGTSKDLKDAAKQSVLAGCDMDMESYGYIKHLKELVEEKKVDEALIDDAARRILNVKYELGLFDDPYKYCNEEREKAIVNAPVNRDKVRELAKSSIVLLKNDNDLLPIKKGQKVAVIGPMTNEKNSPLGSWRLASDDNSAVSLREGLSNYNDVFWAYFDGVRLIDKPTNFLFETKINTTNRTGIDEAVEAAKKADVVILALGEHGYQSGEARSRSVLNFPGLQEDLLQEVYAVNKNIVLVSMSGRPLILKWEDENIPAIIQAWQLGSETGNALASVIMGDYNPSGKLPMTFPRSLGQLPLYYNYKNTGRPTDEPGDIVFWSHYIDEKNTPLYPFGHGLSYTDFTYSNLHTVVNEKGGVFISVDVKNTGKVDGHEVVQLYIRDLVASTTRPVKELKGFEKTFLKSGETKTINFDLTDKELGFYNQHGKYIVEPGDFQIMVGGSSDTSLDIVITTN